MIDQHPYDEDLEREQHRGEVEDRVARHAPAGTSAAAIRAAVERELDEPAPFAEQRVSAGLGYRPSILEVEARAAAAARASQQRRAAGAHRRSWLEDLARAVCIATFAVALALAVYAWLASDAHGAVPFAPAHDGAPVFLAGVAPARVQAVAQRMSEGVAGYAVGARVITGLSVLGCARYPGRFEWRCLARFEFEGTHCDVVEALGRKADARRPGIGGRITVEPQVARFRVVWGPCNV